MLQKYEYEVVFTENGKTIGSVSVEATDMTSAKRLAQIQIQWKYPKARVAYVNKIGKV